MIDQRRPRDGRAAPRRLPASDVRASKNSPKVAQCLAVLSRFICSWSGPSRCLQTPA